VRTIIYFVCLLFSCSVSIVLGLTYFLLNETPEAFIVSVHIAYLPYLLFLDIHYQPQMLADTLKGIALCSMGSIMTIGHSISDDSNIQNGMIYLLKSDDIYKNSFPALVLLALFCIIHGGIAIQSRSTPKQRLSNLLNKYSGIIYFAYAEYVLPYLCLTSSAHILLHQNKKIIDYAIPIIVFVST